MYLRSKKTVLVLIVWIGLVIVGFTFNDFQWTPFFHSSNFMAFDLKQSNLGEENTDEITSNDRRNVIYATTPNSLELEAEMESKKRKEIVNNVCQKYNATNIFDLPADPEERKKTEQRFRSLRQHLILNEEHKVLFCFMPKVGCMTMKKVFAVMGNLYQSIQTVQKAESVVVRFNNKKFTEEQRRYMLKDFYKFMIVRDPFERLVSAYQDKLQNRTSAAFKTSFSRTVKAINDKYRQNKKPVGVGGSVTFTEFIRHLIDTPAWKLNDHWMPYENLCRPCDVKYNFIGSIDTLERDVTHVMRQIHANETKCNVMQASSKLGKTKLATARFFKKLPRKYFDQLLAIRKTDFELFGYPLPKYQTLEKHYHA